MSRSDTPSFEKDKTSDLDYFNFGFDHHETGYPLDNDVNRASLIGSFQMVFDNSVYGENWDYETTANFLESTSQKDYEGVLAASEGGLVGFVWGHRLEPDMAEDYPAELQEAEVDVFDGESYILDELGVLPEYRGQGIGQYLEEQYIEDVTEKKDASRIVQRTQNSSDNVVKLSLDDKTGFEPILDQTDEPIIEEVPLVGLEESDKRIYLWREV